MKKIAVNLKHCYGIKKLEAEFDFTTGRAYAIYAPNGVMKSSFARAFKDIAEENETIDRVFPTAIRCLGGAGSRRAHDP